MCPQEWWWIYDARVGEPRYGNLVESDCARFYNVLEAAEQAAKEANG